MSILKNSVSVTRFDVLEVPSSDDGSGLIEILRKGFHENKFKDIEPNEEIAFGWTNTLDNFYPDFETGLFIVGNYVHVSLRVDKKTVPSSVLKKEVFIACREECLKLGTERLSKGHVAEIKERKMEALLLGAYAVPSCFDVIWDVENKNLMLLHTNSIAIEILENLMFESFGVKMRMIFPFTLAMKNFNESVLAQIKPTTFA